MTNAELIKALRCDNLPDRIKCAGCPYYANESHWCDETKIDRAAADALEAAEQRIKELSLDCELFQQKCMELEAQNPKRILGYDAEKLILFAMMCEKNDVREADLKQAAWNLEFAVRAVMNERAEIVKNTADEITMRFTPDFEKAFAEMRGEHDE